MKTLCFYVGCHHPSDAHRFDYACISYGAIRNRKGDFRPAKKGWLLDSWAFQVLKLHGDFPDAPEVYAMAAARWAAIPRLDAVVSQDYMCEPMMLARTGKTVVEHQRLTIQRYDAIKVAWIDQGEPATLMPVIQGWTVKDYRNHVIDYGERLAKGALVGVGSVCKRQGSIWLVEDILSTIKEVRPDLRLHGFWPEDHGAGEPPRSAPASQLRQHGVVVCGSLRGPGRQRLARGRGLRRARERAASGGILPAVAFRAAA